MRRLVVACVLFLIFLVSVSAQIQVETIGAQSVSTYEGCRNKVFGLVGASNTWDSDPSGTVLTGSWSNVNIIKELCPGATVFLQARGGTWPGAQVGLVNNVLQNENLDYVILNPSANGQQAGSSITPEQYKNAAINLAQIVKDKDSSIEVIMLTNTPTKGAASGYGAPEAIQRIKNFNSDLLNNKLGRPELIDYAVDTYSATESSPGSDTCGYCGNDKGGLGDGTHFGPAGRRKVMETVMKTVFGQPSTPTSTSASTPTGIAETVQPAAGCLNSQRCKEIDEVWVKITQWLLTNRKGKVWSTVHGWIGFDQLYNPKQPAVNQPNQQNNNQPQVSNPSLTGTNALANKLYNDLLPKIGNQNLAKAMVGNAMGESRIDYQAAGDCGSYAQQFSSSIPISGQGRCCSFGLWQYNICGGLGTTYLQYYGSPAGDQARLAEVQNYQKNVEFMTYYLKQNYASVIAEQRTTDQWVDWFVREIERPADPSGEITRRQQIVRDFESAGVFGAISNQQTTQLVNGCTPEMANIDGEYCIDRWENSIYNQNNPSQKASSFYPAKTSQANLLYDQWVNGWQGTPPSNPAYSQMPERGAETITGFAPLAVSQQNVIPNMYVTKEIAEQACANAGKKLCTADEWLQACKGPSQTQYPYGNSYEAGNCNTQGGYPPATVGWTNVIPTNQFDPGDPRNGKAAVDINGVRPTGSFSSCTNDYGVYDMVGNLAEVVSTSAPNGNAWFRGSAFMRRDDASCEYQNTAHSSTYTDYSFGFRCCTSLQ